MKEQYIHDLIEQEESEAKQRVYERLKERLPFLSDETVAAKPKPKPRRNLWAVLGPILACLVVLAVVLPITLQSSGGDAPRFCDSSQYEKKQIEQNLQQFSSQKGLNLLYVDWYEASEKTTTYCAYSVDDDNDIIFLNEVITNGDTGYKIEMYVTDNRTSVDILDSYKGCNKEMIIEGISVKLGSDNGMSTRSKFTYKDYTYYLMLDSEETELMADIITEMLNR